MTTRVALVGASGKLGRIIGSVIEQLDGFETVAVLGSSSGQDELDGVDLIVDASTPASSAEVVRAAAERGTNLLVGTSGWSAERIDQVRPVIAEAGIGVLFVPNFSLGSVLGTVLATLAAPFFGSIEIVEAHQHTKIDSPSGTAVRTAELIAAARTAQGPVDAPHTDQRARGQQVAGIPVHALRRPGVIAKQEVILSGAGESLSIVHDTVQPAAAYAPGIRLALPYARDLRGIAIGLENVIDLGIRPRT
ncbi:4-hydroxy-tetrahydrodipicolinate reductase [uncultured Microbacterium sp.]|uniref:4-hydroxy-tetrahydrodipicolinate reductase n=1 Tax=uncultured Microbacterium sp. TaxID=191216 RepID=UPI0025D10EAD|nr:4-hydroxy-tetrahydrodipicolinate reductase [uncultured Microbacterium sp.]